MCDISLPLRSIPAKKIGRLIVEYEKLLDTSWKSWGVYRCGIIGGLGQLLEHIGLCNIFVPLRNPGIFVPQINLVASEPHFQLAGDITVEMDPIGWVAQ